MLFLVNGDIIVSYRRYLKSDKWLNLKKQVFERDKHRCQTCHAIKQLEVHHVTYDRLGNENLDDLIMLCKLCHEAITNVIRGERYKGKEIREEIYKRTIPEESKGDKKNGNVREIKVQIYRRETPSDA
jgi:5-methylcytosine-specific restriction endonuclease McrA